MQLPRHLHGPPQGREGAFVGLGLRLPHSRPAHEPLLTLSTSNFLQPSISGQPCSTAPKSLTAHQHRACKRLTRLQTAIQPNRPRDAQRRPGLQLVFLRPHDNEAENQVSRSFFAYHRCSNPAELALRWLFFISTSSFHHLALEHGQRVLDTPYHKSGESRALGATCSPPIS